MITHPIEMKTLPWWLRLAFTHAEKHVAAKSKNALCEFSTFLNVLAINESVPLAIRRLSETFSAWLDRFVWGEDYWAEMMREIEIDMAANRADNRSLITA